MIQSRVSRRLLVPAFALTLLLSSASAGLAQRGAAGRDAQFAPTPVQWFPGMDSAATGRTITVLGQATLSGTSDTTEEQTLLVVHFNEAGSDVDQVVDTVERKVADTKAALTKLGIADKDMVQEDFGVHSMGMGYGHGKPGMPAPGGDEQDEMLYGANAMLRVTIRDAAQVSAAMRATIKAGASSVNSMGSGHDFYGPGPVAPANAEQQAAAVQAAMSDARAQAETIAKAAGLQLGGVRSVASMSGPFFGPEGGMVMVQVTFDVQG